MDLLENNNSIDITHWYYWRKYKKLHDALHSLALKKHSVISDIGAGSAIFTLQLAKDFPDLVFWAVDINYSFELLPQTDLHNLHFSRDHIDADVFLLNDVLEHVKDPVAFLQNIVHNAKERATFLITVPALPILWSGHDEFLGHYKRYTGKVLQRELSSSGIDVIQLEYLYWLIFPIVLLARKFFGKARSSQMKPRPIIDFCMKLLMRFESRIPIHSLIGISIWCIAQSRSG